MDRSNPHIAILIVLLFIVGAFGLTFYLFNRAQITLTFTSPHGAVDIYMDGVQVGTTPVALEKVPFGFRRFSFVKNGFETKEWVYDCKPNMDYGREIFLSDNSIETRVIPTVGTKFASPAVFVDDYYLIVGTEGQIEYLDSNLQKVWTNDLGEIILAPTLVAQNLIVVGTFEGSLYGLNAKDGRIIWHHNLGNNVTPLTLNDDIIWVYAGNNLLSIDNSGQILTDKPLTNKMIVDSFCFLNGLPTFIDEEGFLFSMLEEDWLTTEFPVRGKIQSSIITENYVYILGSMGDLYCYTHDAGQVYLIEHSFNLPATLKLDQNLLITSGNTISLVDPQDGKIVLQRELGEDLNEICVSQGLLLVGGESRFLFFFTPDGDFITAKDFASSIFGVSSLPHTKSFLVTTQNGVSIVKKPGS